MKFNIKIKTSHAEFLLPPIRTAAKLEEDGSRNYVFAHELRKNDRILVANLNIGEKVSVVRVIEDPSEVAHSEEKPQEVYSKQKPEVKIAGFTYINNEEKSITFKEYGEGRENKTQIELALNKRKSFLNEIRKRFEHIADDIDRRDKYKQNYGKPELDMLRRKEILGRVIYYGRASYTSVPLGEILEEIWDNVSTRQKLSALIGIKNAEEFFSRVMEFPLVSSSIRSYNEIYENTIIERYIFDRAEFLTMLGQEPERIQMNLWMQLSEYESAKKHNISRRRWLKGIRQYVKYVRLYDKKLSNDDTFRELVNTANKIEIPRTLILIQNGMCYDNYANKLLQAYGIVQSPVI